MNAEFEKLYNEYNKVVCILSSTSCNVPQWDDLVRWSKEHKEEAVDCIIEILDKEPNDIVRLCYEMFPDIIETKGYIPLKSLCSIWLTITILKAYRNESVIDLSNVSEVYKEYDEYYNYIQDNYIPWNPFKEEDPNVSYEEYKAGKRNDENRLTS